MEWKLYEGKDEVLKKRHLEAKNDTNAKKFLKWRIHLIDGSTVGALLHADITSSP